MSKQAEVVEAAIRTFADVILAVHLEATERAAAQIDRARRERDAAIQQVALRDAQLAELCQNRDALRAEPGAPVGTTEGGIKGRA